MLHRNGAVDDKTWGVMQQCVYERKTCDTSMTCRNARRALGLTLNRKLSRLRLTSSVTVLDHVCMLVVGNLGWGGGTGGPL